MSSDLCHFWLASYPRSGNTLARVTLSHAFCRPGEQDKESRDRNFPELQITGAPYEPLESRIVISPDTGIYIPSRFGVVRFVKTHWCSPEVMRLLPNSIGAAYFVRHPMDVFLSGLNYMYVHADEFSTYREYFTQSGPKPIDQIARDGELQAYLDDFCRRRGFWPMSLYSGTWSENVRNWTGKQPSVLVIPYVDIVNQRKNVLGHIARAAGIDLSPEQIENAVSASDETTQPDGRFFWRRGDDIKSRYVRVEMIRQVEAALYPNAEIDAIPQRSGTVGAPLDGLV